MPAMIDRNEVQRLVSEQNALIVEVMPKEEYDEEHIAGAVNIPVKEMNAGTTSHLDKGRPLITYCWDMQ